MTPAGAGRPTLVGEDNPHGGREGFALHVLPRGRAGDRLRAILGMSTGQYLRTFARVNLCGDAWSASEARRRAHEVGLAATGPLVLLGSKVARSFGLKFRPFCRASLAVEGRALRVVMLPHPSGRCRLWNERGARARARRAVRGILGTRRG